MMRTGPRREPRFCALINRWADYSFVFQHVPDKRRPEKHT